MLIELFERHVLKRSPRKIVGEALLIDLSAIFIWRGIWGFMDLYFFPSHHEFSLAASILLGVTIMLFIRLKGTKST